MKWVQLYGNWNILWHRHSLGLEWKLTFSSPVTTAEFSKVAGMLSAALSTESPFKILNNLAGIPSPPLSLFVVMFPKAHLTSHSRMFDSRWVEHTIMVILVIETFSVQFCIFLPPLLLLQGPYISILYCAHLCVECSLGISSFLEEISSLFHLLLSSVSLHCSLKKAFWFLLSILWNSAFSWVNLSLFPLSLVYLLFSAICKTSSDNHFAFLYFFFWGMVLVTISCTMLQTSVHSSSGSLPLPDLIPQVYLSPPLLIH